MTQMAKLYARALANPRGLTFREFQRLLIAFGFALRRQRGSHRSYGRAGISELLVVQPRGAEAKAYQVRQLFDIVQRHGLTLDD